MPIHHSLSAVLLAAATLAPAARLSAQSAPPPSPAAAPSAASDQNVQELAKYFVTDVPMKPFENGTNLDLPRTSDDVQAYTIINRQAIDQSNFSSLSEFLQNELTQDTTSQQYNQGPGGNAGANASSSSLTSGGHVAGLGSVNLRGLGTLQTLVLLDGARVATESFANAEVPSNVDQIPLSAIDHIEVLPSSASGIYGSAAVGGVINVVLRKNYSGGEIDAGYANTFNTDSAHRTLGFDYGFSIGEHTHVSIIAGYDEAKTPVIQDRTFLVDRISRVLQNNPTLLSNNNIFTLGSTPGIYLDSAAVSGYTNPAGSSGSLILKNGVSLNSLRTFIPPGTSPATSVATLDAGLIANAGQQNFNLAPGRYDGTQEQIEPFPRNESIRFSIGHDFGPKLESYADFGVTAMKLVTFWNGGDNNTAGVNETIPVPGNAANNPFEQNVFVSVPLPESQGERIVNTNVDRYGVVGLIAHLPAGWEVLGEFSYTSARYENFYQQLDISPAATGTGLLGASAQLVANGTLNLFTDTVAYPQNYSSYAGNNYEWFPSALADANLRASGPVFTLPAGSARLTVGLEDRADFLNQGLFLYTQAPLPSTTQTAPFSLVRDIYPGAQQLVQAGYVETEIPVVAPKNEIWGVNDFELQAAGRIEQFNTSSDPAYSPTTAPMKRQWAKYSSTNPTFGFKYRPVKSVTLRGSYAAGFVPPTPSQLQTNPAAAVTASGIFFDPKLGTSYTTFTQNIGGNPNLKPQNSKSWNLGVIWEPDFAALSGLRFNVEFYKIYEYNLIQSPGLQITVNAPDLQNYVTRDPVTGQVTQVVLQMQNRSLEYTDGWDASADYRKATSAGTFNLHVAGTLIEHLKEPPAPGSPLVEYVGFVNSGGADRLKVNATLTWLLGRNWTVGWNTGYFDSYKQSGAASDPEYLGAASYTPITTYLLAQGKSTIPAQVYHNVFASYRFGTSPILHHWMDRTTLQVGINDVFNTVPPFDAYQSGGIAFYSPYGSPLLRQYVVKIKKEF